MTNGASGAACVNRQISLTRRGTPTARANHASAAGWNRAFSAAVSRRVSVMWKNQVSNT